MSINTANKIPFTRELMINTATLLDRRMKRRLIGNKMMLSGKLPAISITLDENNNDKKGIRYKIARTKLPTLMVE